MGIKLLKIIPSDTTKKYSAYFLLDNGKEKKVNFGQKGARDFILMNNKKSTHYIKSKEEREKIKQAYITRHAKEDQTDPMQPATLSRYISWSTSSFGGSIRNFKKKFNV